MQMLGSTQVWEKTGQKLDLSSSDSGLRRRGEKQSKKGEEGGSVIMACQ